MTTSTTDDFASASKSQHSGQPRVTPKQKPFHPGYRPVLLREDIKRRLAQFRTEQGVKHDSHIERCLVSAALELVLGRSDLHQQWIAGMVAAVSEDTRLAFSISNNAS